jgi:N-acylglucosamine 2-epimerase
MITHRHPNAAELARVYRTALLDDVMPFWQRHGIDREHGGFLTAVDRDGSLLDTDKSVWFQGRSSWTFATLYNTVLQKPEWLEAARSGVAFLERYCRDVSGKYYFTVTREGRPLRMRRYVYSESFAAIAHAAVARATGRDEHRRLAEAAFAAYLDASFTPGRMPPKVRPDTRPQRGIGPLMIAIATAQELRKNLGDISVSGRSCTAWIDECIRQIEHYFVKPDLGVVMEVVGPDGQIIDHFDGRQLNPGHAIEAAWFVLHEARIRNDSRLCRLGLQMLDWMWARGWDETFGGIFYFRDVYGKPVQEYWHDMKFWWPHCEAIIATLLAYALSGDTKYLQWHRQVHDWSFKHFADPEHGEWYGYLHRDGRVSVPLKGNMWKGPFHLPRALWYCWQLLDAAVVPTGGAE